MGKPGVLQSMGLQSQTRLSYWTELFGIKHEEDKGTRRHCSNPRKGFSPEMTLVLSR